MKDIINKSEYIGYNISYILQYIKKTHENKSNKRFLLIYGKAGVGKTTLFQVLENDIEDITIRRTNASDQRKVSDIKVGNYISSGFNKNPIILLDEADGLQKNTWKKIEEMSKVNLTVPIVLIANDISKIPKNIIKKCQRKELKISRFSLLAFARRENKAQDLGLTESQIDEYVDRCQSYRCLQTMLAYGYSDEMSIPLTQNQQILAAMHGHRTEFKTGDLRNIITIYHDNVKNTELVSQADIWLNRYEHGYGYGKNIVMAILNSIRSKKLKLEYPRTYSLIYKARNKDKIGTKSVKSNKKMPNIAVIGLK